MRSKKIGVIMGGVSSEREVSMLTGKAVSQALQYLGYRVVDIDAGWDLVEVLLREKIDVAFNALHGTLGEDGYIQGLLEWMRIPYTGPDLLYCALSMDKELSRIIFEREKIPVPPWQKYVRGKSELEFDFPFVVKPVAEGSSVGVEIIESEEQFENYLERSRGDLLIEKYLRGREITVGILEGKPIGTVEIRPKIDRFYSYKAKYTPGGTEYLVPAPLSRKEEEEVFEIALRAHRALKGGDEEAVRVDTIYVEGEGFYVLEINALPGMTSTSLLPKIAKHAGIDFPELVERILLKARLRGKW